MLVNLFINTNLWDLLTFKLLKGFYVEYFKKLIELDFYSFISISSSGQLAYKSYKKLGSLSDLNKLRKLEIYSIIDSKGDYSTKHNLELSLGNFNEHWKQHFYSKIKYIVACFNLKFIILAEVNWETLKCQHGLVISRYLWVKDHKGLCTWRHNIGSYDYLLSSWSLKYLKSNIAVYLKICCHQLDSVLLINF